ncbi:MAG: endonuclease NucS domain-containing protein [Pseudomonadota bacterium]
MREEEYRKWFEQNAPNVKNPRITELRKIESHYGNIDEHFANGTYQGIIDSLQYSMKDKRENKPNPSKIIMGDNVDLRENLATYKAAAMRYQEFLNDCEFQPDSLETQGTISNSDIASNEETQKQRLSIERDMQVALRRNIKSLEPSLKDFDGGKELVVDSGRIDITCEDNDGYIVVIELKAGKAPESSIAQILGYMGDLAKAENRSLVRGILVAHDFSNRTKSAASVVPTLKLMKYSIEFKFTAEE